MSRRVVVFHSALTPEALQEALRRLVDPAHRTLFSLSGYKGHKPVLGDVYENSFWLGKRPSLLARNDFAPRFYAQLTPESGGTRIEGYFEMARWVKWFMRGWIAFAAVVGAPIFVVSLAAVLRAGNSSSSDNWVGVIAPPALIAWGFILPKIGDLFGYNDKRYISEFIQNSLAARLEGPGTKS